MGGIKKRKAMKRLERRLREYDQHGPRPAINPGKVNMHEMHRPGSLKK